MGATKLGKKGMCTLMFPSLVMGKTGWLAAGTPERDFLGNFYRCSDLLFFLVQTSSSEPKTPWFCNCAGMHTCMQT